MEMLAWLILAAASVSAVAPLPPDPLILALDSVGVSLRFNACRSDGDNSGLGTTLLTAPTLGSGAFTLIWQLAPSDGGQPPAVLFSQPVLRRLDLCSLTRTSHDDGGLRVSASVASNGTALVEIAAISGGSCRFSVPVGGAGGSHFLAVGPFDGCVAGFGGGSDRHCFQPDCETGSPISRPSEATLRRSKRAVCSAGDCKNGGVCNPYGSNPICICNLPYIAPYCREMSNYCTQNQTEDSIYQPVCINGNCTGTIETRPYFQCSCTPGFNGSRCNVNSDDCLPKPCINGMCTDLVNDYSCSCYTGWEGRNCSVDTDYCALSSSKCAIRDHCIDGNSTCDCKSGWRGANCSLVDPCTAGAAPCPNGTKCVSLDPDGYECLGVASFGSSVQPVLLAPSGLSEAPMTIFGRVRTRVSAQLLSLTTRGNRTLALGLTPSGQLAVTLDNQTATAPNDSLTSLTNALWFSFSVFVKSGLQISLSVDQGNGTWTGRSSGPLGNDTDSDPVAMVNLAPRFKGCLENVRLNTYILPLTMNWSRPAGKPGFDWLPTQSATPLPLIGCQGDPVCSPSPCLNAGTCEDMWNDWACKCAAGYSGPICNTVNCSVAVCPTTAPPFNTTAITPSGSTTAITPSGNTTAAFNVATAGVSTAVVVVLSVLAIVIVIVVIVVVTVKLAQKRRAESGQYKPSKEETHHDTQMQARDPDIDLDDNIVLGNMQVAKL